MGGNDSYNGGYGGHAPMEVDADAKLRRRIGWLNKDGGFENRINYQKIYEAAKGLEVGRVMEILKDLEENRETIKDPTAYAAAALRKRGPGGMGVRRKIQKKD